MTTPRIRHAALADAERMAELLGQLGYPSGQDSIPQRLAGMSRERETLTVVAESGGKVVGLAAAQVMSAIHADEPLGILMALVIDQGSRGTGVGRALVAHVEDWVRGKGATKLTVLTGDWRPEAHRFYEHIGFSKNGLRYIKPLS